MVIKFGLRAMHLYVILLFTSVPCLAQFGFLHSFGDTQEGARVYRVFLDMINERDTLILYSTTRDEAFDPGIGFIKLDTSGNVLQVTQVVNPDTIHSTVSWSRKKIIRTSDGGFAILGAAIGLDTHNLYLMRVDRNLDLVDVDYYLADQFMGNGGLIEVDGGYMLVAYIEQENIGFGANALVIKVDLEGIELWRRTYGTFELNEISSSVYSFDEEHIHIAGLVSNYQEDGRPIPQSTWSIPYVMEIDSAGDSLWSWKGDTMYYAASIEKMLPLDDGGWMCTSSSWEPNPQGGFVGRPVLVRYDSDFNVVWEQVFGYVGARHSFRDLERTHDGHFLASGFIATDRSRSPCAVHYKFSIDGDSIWMRGDTIYPNSRTIIQATEILSSGSIISIGYVSVGPFGETGFVMKLSPDGCLDTINCFQFSSTEDIIYSADVLRIYPNPANEQISIDLPDRLTGPTTIIVRDIQGRIVREDVHTYATGSVNLHVAQLTAGQYFVEVQTRGQNLYGRFVKL